MAFRGGLEVYLRMSLASNGELVDVRVVRSSGDVLFDRSAVTAVQRSAPFDEVKRFDAATFEEKFRTLTVKFRPDRRLMRFIAGLLLLLPLHCLHMLNW